MIVDVKRAFLYGNMKRKVYLELPHQDERSTDPGAVGLLKRSMYGTRDAPFIWQEEVRRVMEKMGFIASMLQPVVYHHALRKINAVAHVDDFLCTGRAADLQWLEAC